MRSLGYHIRLPEPTLLILHHEFDLIYRVIQSCSTIFKEIVGEIIWSRKFKYHFFSDSLPVSHNAFELMFLFIIATV
jgi:hypothetical protein